MNKRIRSLIYFGIAIAILGVGGYFVYMRLVAPPPKMNADPVSAGRSTGAAPAGNPGGGSRALPVSVYIAKYSDVSDGRVNLGTLLANEVVDLASQTSGRVVLINFKEGEWVDKGALLVKIDDLDFQAQLTRAEHQFSLAAEKLERQRILLAKDAVSREAFDQAQTDYNLIAADIELLKVRIDRTEIRAPFRGVVGFRSVSLGSYLQAGAKVATLVDMATLKLEFSVPEKYAFQNLDGAIARFTVAGSEKEYVAKVYAIDPVLEAKTKSIGLRALYDNSRGTLYPGMSAKVSIDQEQASMSLLVPSEAVVPDVEGRTVWTVKNGKAIQVPVKTGNRTADMVEILEGIAKGDSVITSGLLQIRQGMTVQAVTF